MAKLFIEYRIWLNPSSNQDLVHETAEALKDKLYDLVDEEQSPIRTLVKDITYMVKMEEERKKV